MSRKAAGAAGLSWVLCGAPELAFAQTRAAPAGGDNQQAIQGSAAAPAPAGSVSIQALFGSGVVLGAGKPVLDNTGIGAGVRAGYTSGATHWYLGGTVLGFRPEADTMEVQLYTVDFELGREFSAGPLLLRPYLGLGAGAVLFGLTERSEAGARGGSGISLELVPGFLVSYPLGPFRVGAEVRYAIISTWRDTLSLLGSAGVAF